MKPSENLTLEERSGSASERYLEALIEKDRLSYLSGFVQGFVHNINGPLQNISMLSEILSKGEDAQDRFVRARCTDSTEEWEGLYDGQRKRIQQLTQQVFAIADMLRDFMLLHEVERNEASVDVNLVLSKLASVFRADLFFKHQVSFDLRLTKNLPMVKVCGCHLIPSLVHLFRNALTALRGAPEKRLVLESRLEGDCVRILFRDSGCGLACREGLFDLFVSLWPDQDERENHLGFGLYAVKRLLEPYGISVRLEEAEGETMAIVDIPT
ncbi:MAG: sensor histidine kinase [Acidobacteriota bacterium]